MPLFDILTAAVPGSNSVASDAVQHAATVSSSSIQTTKSNVQGGWSALSAAVKSVSKGPFQLSKQAANPKWTQWHYDNIPFHSISSSKCLSEYEKGGDWAGGSCGHFGLTHDYGVPEPVVYLDRPGIQASGVNVRDVVAHEFGHTIQAHLYGSTDAAMPAMTKAFGGGELGIEYAADCMAKVQGAKFLNYTQCTSPQMQALARKMLNGFKV